MPDEDVKTTSGVEAEATAVPAAGEQEIDIEKLLFGEEENTGVEEEGAADPNDEAVVEAEEKPKEVKLPEDASKAFATKLAAEKDKMRDEIRSEIMQEIERTKNTPEQQRQGAPAYQGLSEEEIEKLADDLDASPKLVRVVYEQQMRINQQEEINRKMTAQVRDRSEYESAKTFAQEMVAKNETMPVFDDKVLHNYRMKYYQEHAGATLPWKEAYKMLVADTVMSGDLTREAQQAAIEQIKERDKTTVGLKSPAAQKPTIDDLPSDQFNKLVEEAKSGKYKRE
jgi:hypothetical protein